MQTFQHFLCNYLKRKHISYKAAASMCDIDRTQLRRYATESRLPNKAEIFEKIANGLTMSESDKEEMELSIICSKLGAQRYKNYRQIFELFNNNIYENVEKDEDRLIKKDYRMYEMIKAVTEGVNNIYVMYNPEYFMLTDFFDDNIIQNKDIKIEHFVEVGDSVDEEVDLRVLENMLAVKAIKCKYKIYHKYKSNNKMNAGIECGFVMSDKGVVVFTYNQKTCMEMNTILIKQEPMIDYYRQKINNQIKESYVYANNYLRHTSDKWEKDESDIAKTETVLSQLLQVLAYRYEDKGKQMVIIINTVNSNKLEIEEIGLADVLSDYLKNQDIVNKLFE